MKTSKSDLTCEDCWWRVLIIVLVIGISAMACFSGWPWKESPWQAISAIATSFAAFIALFLGVREGDWRRARELQEKKMAGLYLIRQGGLLAKASRDILRALDDWSARDEGIFQGAGVEAKRIQRIVASIDRVDLNRVLVVDESIANTMSLAVSTLEYLRIVLSEADEVEGLMVNHRKRGPLCNNLEKALRDINWVVSEVDRLYTSLN